MLAKSDNIEFMIYDNADEVVKELFDLLLTKYLNIKLDVKRQER